MKHFTSSPPRTERSVTANPVAHDAGKLRKYAKAFLLTAILFISSAGTTSAQTPYPYAVLKDSVLTFFYDNLNMYDREGTEWYDLTRYIGGGGNLDGSQQRL